jgi:hypothetical protein
MAPSYADIGMRQAGRISLYDLLEEALTAGSPNATAKTTCVVGGMLADAGSIDDLELLRHGGMGRLFGGIRAPSTLGTFLRSFTRYLIYSRVFTDNILSMSRGSVRRS